MKRHGFTLVELLVVIAVIGMLVAMLLPAVQMARETARRSQCSNHIKQLALACLNVESRSRTLPSTGWGYGWIGDPDAGSADKQPGSWCYSILPALEQEALFRMTADGFAPENVQAASKIKAEELQNSVVPVFYCPSRRQALLYPAKQPRDKQNYSLLSPCSKTDYAGNAGTDKQDPGRILDYEGPTIAQVASYRQSNKWPKFSNQFTGVFFPHSKVTLGMIGDGASNTYLLGEKFMDPFIYEHLEYADGTPNRCDDYCLYCGADLDHLRTTYCGTYSTSSSGGPPTFTLDETRKRPPLKDKLFESSIREDKSFSFGSSHASVFGMGMCDGSVQSISYDLDPEIHQCKGDRSDRMRASGVNFEDKE